MNNKFNENEVRIDCNGNVIDRPFYMIITKQCSY